MNNPNRLKLLAGGALALAMSSSAMAEINSGFYLGITAGESTFDLSKGELDGVVTSTFSQQSAPVLTRSSSLDDGDTTISLVAGYRFLPWVSVEASYVDFGSASYRFLGTVNPPGPQTSAPATLNLDVESKGFTVSGIGSLPVGSMVDLHARLGLLVSQSKVKAVATVDTRAPGIDSTNLDSASAFVGIGGGVHLGRHFVLGVDWTRYLNVGDENDDDDFETEAGFDIDTFTLSAMFKF